MWSWLGRDRKARSHNNWTDNIDRLLHPGEEVEDEVSVGDAQVVVTTQRIVVLTPRMDGENVRYVERPNVVGVETRHSSNNQLLSVGATVGLTGVLLIAIGNTLNLSAPAALSEIDGNVPFANLAKSIASAIEHIDTMSLYLGALSLATAAVLAGYYFWRRERTVALAVAGDKDVEIPTYEDENTERLVERLREAVAP